MASSASQTSHRNTIRQYYHHSHRHPERALSIQQQKQQQQRRLYQNANQQLTQVFSNYIFLSTFKMDMMCCTHSVLMSLSLRCEIRCGLVVSSLDEFRIDFILLMVFLLLNEHGMNT